MEEKLELYNKLVANKSIRSIASKSRFSEGYVSAFKNKYVLGGQPLVPAVDKRGRPPKYPGEV